MKRITTLLITSLFILLILTVLGSSDAVAENPIQSWSRFRGENGTGISHGSGFQTSWTKKDYKWGITLPGKGHSSPVMGSGNRIFLTSAEKKGAERNLLCIDAENGAIKWKKTIALASLHLHKKNSFASGTPATDHENVYVTFTDEKHVILEAYTIKGEFVWRQDFGEYSSQHGPGASPIVYKDLVILTKDMNGPSFIYAVNRKTGKLAWKTERKQRRAAYSTPMIYTDANGNDQLICVSGATGVTGLNPQTGKEIWSSGKLPMRAVASPVFGEGVVIALCGSGGSGKLLVAVEPGSSKSDALKTDAKIRYNRKKELPYVATPIYKDGLLFLWADRGIVSCMKMKTGENIWTKRVAGSFSGSPIWLEGRLYCIDETGTVVVIQANEKFKELGRTNLGEKSYTTPMVINNHMYLRTESHLYCLPAKKTSPIE